MKDKQGLTIFELSSTGEVQEAEYRPGGIFISFRSGQHETNETFLLQEKEGCRYIKALNKKNAIRKFNSQSPGHN